MDDEKEPTQAEVREAVEHSGVFDRQRAERIARALLARMESDAADVEMVREMLDALPPGFHPVAIKARAWLAQRGKS